jgi:hypothetical protein
MSGRARSKWALAKGRRVLSRIDALVSHAPARNAH